MGKIVAMTGASGNMGVESLTQLLASDAVYKVKVLLQPERREKVCKRMEA